MTAAAEVPKLKAELTEFKRIRDLLMKAVSRAIGRANWEDPLSAAIKHADSVAALRAATQNVVWNMNEALSHLNEWNEAYPETAERRDEPDDTTSQEAWERAVEAVRTLAALSRGEPE